MGSASFLLTPAPSAVLGIKTQHAQRGFLRTCTSLSLKETDWQSGGLNVSQPCHD